MARVPNPELAERRRRQILAAALACFRKRGFHQTSVQEICDEAGLSAGALYRYFSSKTEIIAAIVDEDRREVEAAFEQAAASGDIVEAAMQLAGCAARCGQDAALVAEVIAEAVRNPELADKFTEQMDASVALLAGALERARQSGRIRPEIDPLTAARMVAVAIDGLALHTAVRGRKASDVYLESFRKFLSSLLAPPESGPAGGNRVQRELETAG